MKNIIIAIIMLIALFLIASGIKVKFTPFKISLTNWDIGLFVVLAYISVMYVHKKDVYNERNAFIIECMPVIQQEHINEQINIVNQWNDHCKKRIERLKQSLNDKEMDEFDRGYLRAVNSYERDINEVYTKVMDELKANKEKLNK